ncbi:MAG: hypothetical protein JSW05_06495 [Candidatus Thorarchaeota archaeon]|nr:MAG: hypothetical protein JSW05_06495 [Candidatus Thorarchaeota archaeon]
MVRSHEIVGATVVLLLIIGTVNGQLAEAPSKFPNILTQADTTITMGTTDSVEASIDPAQSYDYFGWMMISALSSTLVEITPGSDAGSNDIQGALAESWAMSGGGTIWDFNLRQGLTFFDGYPFNASAVKYSFDRNIGLALPDGPQLNMDYAGKIENVTITGEYSVRFYLHMPFAPFLQLMSCAASAIVHPSYAPLGDYVRFTASDARASHPCGLGPFILTEWDRVGGSDISMRLEKNPNYWSATYPQADVVIIEFYPTETGLASAMSSGEIDVAYRHLTKDQTNTFRSNPDFTVWEALSPRIQFLCFQQDIYPFNETRIRQGIAAALNRSHMAEAVFENSVSPLLSIIPDRLAYHKPSFQKYGDANYTYTQDCLDDFGYNSTNKLEIELWYESSGHYPSRAEQALVYQSDLEASGVIDVTLYGADWITYRMNRNLGIMSLFIYGWYPDYFDADDFAFLPFASWLNMGYNSSYPQGGIDQYSLWLDGRSATTDLARQTAYESLQDLQANECSIVPLWQGHSVAVSTTNVHDVVFDITASWYFGLLTIDLPPPTTTTTTTTTTSTTTTTTGTDLPIDPMVIAAGTGIGVVAILTIALASRRRRPPRRAPEVAPTEPFAPLVEEVPVMAEAERPPREIAPWEQTPVIPPEKTVNVLRGGEIIGGRFEYKVKVKNDTDYVINNVTVNILAYPEDCLEISERTVKTIKRIGPGEFRSPQFTFIPTKDCVEGKVIATVSYIDHQDVTKMLGAEPYVIRSVCDLLTPLESTIENFELILGEMVATSDERIHDWNPEVLFTKVKALLPAKNFYILDSSSRIGDGRFVGEIRGLAEGKYTGKRVAVRLAISGVADGNQASVRVEGLGDDEAMLPTTIDELTKSIDSWTCMNCGAAFEPIEVNEIRDGRPIQCRYCRHTMTIDLYRK